MSTAPALLGASGAAAWTLKHQASPAVRRWRPSLLPHQRTGSLHCRVANVVPGDSAVTILLHGLVASGDIFGAHFDRLGSDGPLIVPDLLGFGRSIDTGRNTFGAVDHLDALDEMLHQLGLADRRIRLGAHSMGSALAMRWLERHPEQIASVTCFGPPIYRDATDMNATIADSGLMSRLFVANTSWAKAACRLNCSHRHLAGLAAAALTPDLPIPIARAASLHTWPAYRDALDDVVSTTQWTDLARIAQDHNIPMTTLWGADDTIGDRDFASTIGHLKTITIPGAGHHLPLTHPQLCVEQIATSP